MEALEIRNCIEELRRNHVRTHAYSHNPNDFEPKVLVISQRLWYRLTGDQRVRNWSFSPATPLKPESFEGMIVAFPSRTFGDDFLGVY